MILVIVGVGLLIYLGAGAYWLLASKYESLILAWIFRPITELVSILNELVKAGEM